MRVVGKRVQRLPGLRWPTKDEIRFMQDLPDKILCIGIRGIVRYRSHAEANAHMDQLIAERMARQSRKISKIK